MLQRRGVCRRARCKLCRVALVAGSKHGVQSSANRRRTEGGRQHRIQRRDLPVRDPLASTVSHRSARESSGMAAASRHPVPAAASRRVPLLGLIRVPRAHDAGPSSSVLASMLHRVGLDPNVAPGGRCPVLGWVGSSAANWTHSGSMKQEGGTAGTGSPTDHKASASP